MEEEILSFKSPSVRTGGASLNIIDQFYQKLGAALGWGNVPLLAGLAGLSLLLWLICL